MTDVTVGNTYHGDIDYYDAIMVAGVPSSGRVYLRSLRARNAIIALSNPGNWSAWTDFGIPEAGADLISVSVSFTDTYSGDIDYFIGVITARTSSGRVYLRYLHANNSDLILSSPGNWSAWTDFGNPGI